MIRPFSIIPVVFILLIVLLALAACFPQPVLTPEAPVNTFSSPSPAKSFATGTPSSLPAASSPTPTASRNRPTRTPTPTTSPYITPAPDSGEYLRNSTSPNGDWQAEFRSVQDGEKNRLIFRVFRMNGAQEWTLMDEPSILGSPEPTFHGWSPDGQYLYFSYRVFAGGECRFFNHPAAAWQRFDLASGEIETLPLPDGYDHALSWDGRSLAYINESEPLELVFHELESGKETRLLLPAPGGQPGPVSAGSLLWSPNGSSVVVSVAAGQMCEQQKPQFSLLMVNRYTLDIQFLLDAAADLVHAVEWHPSDKILLRDWNGASWWINASSLAAAPVPAPPIPTVPPRELSSEEIIEAVISSATPTLIQEVESPLGQWKARVLRYECTRTSQEQENAYEQILLSWAGGGQDRTVADQLQNCGGLGAAGLKVIFWSSDDRHLYYTGSGEGVPDGGSTGWYPDLVRVDLASGESLDLRLGPLAPDGVTMAFPDPHNLELVLWDLDQGEIARLPPVISLRGAEAGLYGITWSPEGQVLVYVEAESKWSSGKASLVHLNRTNFERKVLYETDDSLITGVAWTIPGEIQVETNWIEIQTIQLPAGKPQ